MRLLQRVAITGLLSVMLILLLTGAFISRYDLSGIVDRGIGPQEHAEQLNSAWLQENVISDQYNERGDGKGYNLNPNVVVNVRHRHHVEPSAVGPPPITHPGKYPIRPPNPPLDDVTYQRREKVKEMMKYGWDNYKRYAWGKNELSPVTKKGHSPSIFSKASMGATIVDGLDTLYIMGLHEEYKEGHNWIRDHLNFDVDSEVSLFETNIRFMGSLLTCYALTGDPMFRNKSLELGIRMLPAFNTETGIPYSLINLRTGASKNYAWASSGCSILSEIGTMHLEFSYLSDITGNSTFRDKVQKVRTVLKNMEKPKGLYPNYIHPKTGKWGQQHMSLGALGDSFYEYLLKAYIQSGKTDVEAKEMYEKAMDAIEEHMVLKSPGGLTYVSDMKFDRVDRKMGHLACFAGGMFALGAKTQDQFTKSKRIRHMEIAEGLTHTCHESYDRTPTKLGPETFHFIEGNEARSLKSGEKYYILRPETFESYFILWRLTKDQKYREWGWEAVQALEKHCRVPGGFTGLQNVYTVDSPKDDVQQSYFFAETLKYLYLLFSDDSLISLDDWVFNSEAHIIPIKGNPYYRAHSSL
ncbi:mannosyl-oligosaccharide alpha-1,2-mannosidase IA isoform X2 [Leptopilina boulardi]|uniref:mannosyl-oligosaccharide alpha-1,2-mannosidase IA isoform X2 n=1 Tax=Leptopilina boulardi TaxID=63433 RepID=UPI0021F538DC|nr:mannosyl-oligosaccharide alpha-1,2-mannosidase IA isoform X2 [Leptopilina boulardi]XP_051170745.1 mannosyl-oligosaccharide alpha-1,2-mannosidase IA isoform X2 [Leptopilina boulardi]XP_051170746.1 mannosyl-oligosaccharide alpha-1,2-mannosidase IA isoform X2 [Leptopilina boulardi]XP_051170747.1 mannosyl-oligosaccharide alpha-1,2-mannosidase IA isoform X2 [Leptopilina boulardi]XP_051170748.1 mannosyl-oligosaccharide alpha-1,2-mannosidase IA isoform X2 [Leptopilina boulardi]XP_051170749.1 manno